jgi:hypothetical protein
MSDNTLDISKSKVTREAIGLLLYGIYASLKKNERTALTALISAADLPVPQILQALKDGKVVENTGGAARSATWRWIPASPPNDIIIEKVFNGYTKQLIEYRKKMQEKNDARNGINREESGKATKVPASPSGTPSLFIQERLQAIEDRQRYVIDLIETLCGEWGIKQTIGGFKIGN